MICTCEDCKRNFFSETISVCCPECGNPVLLREGMSEYEYMAEMLAAGQVYETLIKHRNPAAEKALHVEEVIAHMVEVHNSIPEEIQKKYCFELNAVAFFLRDFACGRYYEYEKKRGTPGIETLGRRLLKAVEALNDRIINQRPGFDDVFEKIVNYKGDPEGLIPYLKGQTQTTEAKTEKATTPPKKMESKDGKKEKTNYDELAKKLMSGFDDYDAYL